MAGQCLCFRREGGPDMPAWRTVSVSVVAASTVAVAIANTLRGSPRSFLWFSGLPVSSPQTPLFRNVFTADTPVRWSPHRRAASDEHGRACAAVALSFSAGVAAATMRARARIHSKVGRGTMAAASAGSLHRPTVSMVARRAATVADAPATLITEEVLAPNNDPRTYRVVEMANGMQVFLASDPTADFAAAALSVRCGTFQDPDAKPGLAHFHEHMLFLGTDKFPAEDEYNKYLSEHGGDSNAYTMGEYTTYYFKVAAPHLPGALDRFSQFFISPTFNPSCVEREMKAVDSESTNYSMDDGWRLLQVLKATAAPAHPFHRFDVGNLSTLGVEDTVGTRTELIEWNKKHYQAGAMKLAIAGKESLAELEQTAVDLFGPVRNGAGVDGKQGTPAWSQEQTGKIVYCVPIKEARSISVCWPLPPDDAHKFSKPEVYVAHVLGHEGTGSLHDILNEEGWVDQLSAGPAHSFADGQLFCVNVSLTPEGDANREHVLALLLEYVSLLQRTGPQHEIFKELASLQEINFAHKEDAPALDDFVASAAMTLHKYPAKEALRGPYAIDAWEPSLIQEYMDMLQPEKCLIFVTSSEFSDQASQSRAGSEEEVASEEAGGWKLEQWYGAPFREESLSQDKLKSWKEAVDKELISRLRFPELNQFVPQDFSLRGTADPSSAEASKLPLEITPPTVVHADPMVRIFHKTDSAFRAPRENLLVHINTEAYDISPETVVMLRLFCSIVIDDLNAYAYDASVAGLGYGLSFNENLGISVGGFNDKLPVLLKVVTERIKEVLSEVQSAGIAEDSDSERGQQLLERMDTQRQILLQDYRNFTREEPYSVASYYLTQLLMRDSWHLDEYVKVLEQPASLSALGSAVAPALKRVQLQAFVHGNATSEEAKSAVHVVENMFRDIGSEPLTTIEHRKVMQVPEGKTVIFECDLAADNPLQENNCIENVYVVGPGGEDLKRDACLTMVSHMASVSAFQKLRTEEQLGYIVQSSLWAEHHVSGILVLIQGNRLPPCQMDERIEEWIASFEEELEKMTEDEFANNVLAVYNESTQRYSTLSQETGKHWGEISSRRYRFDSLQKMMNAIQEVTKDDTLQFFRQYFRADGPSRRKISMRVMGTSADGQCSKVSGASEEMLGTLEDIRAFQAANSVFPDPSTKDVMELMS